MRRDYRLYELSDEEFEKLVVQICVKWLGDGVIPFAAGRDGGRDGRFNGTANSFPSEAKPIEGRCVLQAKHTSSPNKSCSDTEFAKLVENEHKKVSALVADGVCDHYLIFTNRKLTGGADKTLIADLMKLNVKSAHVIGLEKLSLALDQYQDIRDSLPNNQDVAPFIFRPDDIVEVIQAIHAYTSDTSGAAFDSAHDFDSVKLRDEKNPVNGVTPDYFQQIIVNGSMPHFPRIEEFLKNPRNNEFVGLYHDSADELKQKILLHRAEFGAFDEVFGFLYEHIQVKRAALRGKRRLISILLHYMYCNCDIGLKHPTPQAGARNAHA
jgi:hypothetical protein